MKLNETGWAVFWTLLIVGIVIAFVWFTDYVDKKTFRVEAEDILAKQEIDVELKEYVRVWLFATDEGRMIYYDGKLFKVIELEK